MTKRLFFPILLALLLLASCSADSGSSTQAMSSTSAQSTAREGEAVEEHTSQPANTSPENSDGDTDAGGTVFGGPAPGEELWESAVLLVDGELLEVAEGDQVLGLTVTRAQASYIPNHAPYSDGTAEPAALIDEELMLFKATVTLEGRLLVSGHLERIAEGQMEGWFLFIPKEEAALPWLAWQDDPRQLYIDSRYLPQNTPPEERELELTRITLAYGQQYQLFHYAEIAY